MNNYGDTTVAGGAIMEGVTLTKVNLRPHDQTVALGEMTFVPYQDTPRHRTPSPSCLVEYTNQCSSLAASILTKFKSHLHDSSIPNKKLFEAVSDFCKKEEDSSVKVKSRVLEQMEWSLLRTLMKISSMRLTRGLADNIVSLLEAFQLELKQDQLLNHMTSKVVLKLCMDVITENLTSRTFRVLEVKDVDTIFGDKVSDQLKQSHRGVVNFQQVDWTLEGAAKPEDLFQLVILDDFLHGQPDISKSLSNVSKMVAADGYLLLLEVTHNFHIQALLNGLVRPSIDVQDSRTLGWYCDTEKWQDIFKMANFEIVMEKADGLLYTTYLLKKKTEVDVEAQTVVHIDDLCFSWLDDLKEKFKDVQTQPKGSNLWLMAKTEKRNGILGLTRCLRREPGGDRVR